jgi:hypothetical protein
MTSSYTTFLGAKLVSNQNIALPNLPISHQRSAFSVGDWL